MGPSSVVHRRRRGRRRCCTGSADCRGQCTAAAARQTGQAARPAENRAPARRVFAATPCVCGERAQARSRLPRRRVAGFRARLCCELAKWREEVTAAGNVGRTTCPPASAARRYSRRRFFADPTTTAALRVPRRIHCRSRPRARAFRPGLRSTPKRRALMPRPRRRAANGHSDRQESPAWRKPSSVMWPSP